MAAEFHYGQTDNEMSSSRNSKKQIRYIQVPKTTVGQKFFSVYVMLLLFENVTPLKKWPQGKK